MQFQFQMRPLRTGLPRSEDSLEERFMAFHVENPHVYDELRRLALDLKRKGVTRYGIAGLFEVLRYDSALATGGDAFKLNNSFRSFYARLLMDNEPRLRDFFELRTMRWQESEVGT